MLALEDSLATRLADIKALLDHESLVTTWTSPTSGRSGWRRRWRGGVSHNPTDQPGAVVPDPVE